MTVNPSVTTLSTVRSKKSTDTDESDRNAPATLIGVQATPTSTPILTTSPEVGHLSSAGDTTGTKGARDAFLGIPDINELLLPDLGSSRELTNEDVIKQSLNTLGDDSQEVQGSQDEQDAVDALLSLSTLPSSSSIDPDYGLEDNALLAPIGGQVVCDDVAPTESRLGQLEVDNQIAQFIAQEEHDKLITEHSQPSSALIGVPPTSNVDENNAANSPLAVDPTSNTTAQDTVNTPVSPGEVHDLKDGEGSKAPNPSSNDPNGNKGTQPKPTNEDSIDNTDKPCSRGAFKSQLYGLRKSYPKDRAYKCQVCGKSKCSMEDLNIHHRNNHNPQRCGVCGKMFELATSLVHHMYSHYTRKFYCDKCNFHCFFQSELEAHKIVHRERPTFKCMHPKCGHWFKRKGELSLQVEVHKKTWYDCCKCDFSTKLIKYLKEHEKSHVKKNAQLPYACDICGERFLWRSGVKRHKEKKH